MESNWTGSEHFFSDKHLSKPELYVFSLREITKLLP